MTTEHEIAHALATWRERVVALEIRLAAAETRAERAEAELAELRARLAAALIVIKRSGV